VRSRLKLVSLRPKFVGLPIDAHGCACLVIKKNAAMTRSPEKLCSANCNANVNAMATFPMTASLLKLSTAFKRPYLGQLMYGLLLDCSVVRVQCGSGLAKQLAHLADPNKILPTSTANNFIKSSPILMIFYLFFSPC
jgi:hypothetical protein